ncbi:TPA: autotransporter domain-containing protein, partial [Escherichia coli]
YAHIIQVSNNALLKIGENASFKMQDIDNYEHYYQEAAAIIEADSGAQVINDGDVSIQNIIFVEVAGENSSAVNNGNIELMQYDFSSSDPSGAAMRSIKNSTVTNNSTITAKMMEQSSVFNMMSGLGVSNGSIANNHVVSMMAIEALNNGYAVNAENGHIDMYGRGMIGMVAIDNSIAENAGQITVDTLWVDENDTTFLRNGIPGNAARDYGAAMTVGTDSYDGARNNATAINKEEGV